MINLIKIRERVLLFISKWYYRFLSWSFLDLGWLCDVANRQCSSVCFSTLQIDSWFCWFSCNLNCRIKKLIDIEALGLSRLSVLLLDIHTDVKGYSLLTLPQVRFVDEPTYNLSLSPSLLGFIFICVYLHIIISCLLQMVYIGTCLFPYPQHPCYILIPNPSMDLATMSYVWLMFICCLIGRDEFWDLYKNYFHQQLVKGNLHICLYGPIPNGNEFKGKSVELADGDREQLDS